jgi:hypothetical protein
MSTNPKRDNARLVITPTGAQIPEPTLEQWERAIDNEDWVYGGEHAVKDPLPEEAGQESEYAANKSHDDEVA